MKPGSTSRGVSIPSQQRLLRYFARTLSDRDPRPPPTDPMRIVKLEWIKLVGPGMTRVAKSILGRRQIAVQVRVRLCGSRRRDVLMYDSSQLRRYKDSIATQLRNQEIALQSSSNAGAQLDFDDETWDDKEDMLVRVGDVVQRLSGDDTASEVSGINSSIRNLYPATAYRPPSNTNEPPFDRASARTEVERNGGGIMLDADREIQIRCVASQPLSLFRRCE